MAPHIDQLVVVMLENRSFDHMLGYLSLDEWRSSRTGRVNGLTTASISNGEHDNPTAEGQMRRPYEMTCDEFLPKDLPHGRTGVATQLAFDNALKRPTMKGFVKAEYPNGPTPQHPSSMGYFTPSHIPVTHFLAMNYMVCDQWFCPIPTDTHPNRLMASSGYSNLDVTGSLTRQESVVDFVTKTAGPSAIQVFAKRISFLALMYDHAIDAVRRRGRFSSFETFAPEWAKQPVAGPKVWIVEPGYSDVPKAPWMTDEEPDCSHPPHPVCRAERFLKQVYDTVTSNKARWERTLMVVTYDEHGGFYDHAIPPQIETKAPAAVTYKPFPGLGPRVPAMLISPYVSAGATCSLLFDHTSILRAVGTIMAPGHTPVFSQAVADRKVDNILEAIDLTAPRAASPCPNAPNDPGTTVGHDPATAGAGAFAAAIKHAGTSP